MTWRKFEKIVIFPRTLWRPLSTPKLSTFLKCFFSSFVKYLDYFWKINNQICGSLPRERFLSKKRKISSMSHRKQFFKGAQDEQKSKNNFCYKCSKFEKTLSCMFWRFKNATQEKIVKKNKKYEIFQGVTFCFCRLHNSDFYIFYFGIGSAYLELPIWVEVKIRLSIKMCPLGAPRPPAHKNSSPDMTCALKFGRVVYSTILNRPTAAST